MSTTPPSDPWGTPADPPEQSEPDQPTPDQPTLDQPPLDQPPLDQPAADQPLPEPAVTDQPLPGGPPAAEEPAVDPWAAPPAPTTEPTGFDRPPVEFAAAGEPQAYPPPAMPPQVPYGEARPKPTPPPSILTAVKLMYAGAVLSGISFVTSLLTQESAREAALENNPSLTESELDTAVAIGITIAVVVGLIAILLWVWMAESNRRGKSWARIVATVLGALNIVFTVVGLMIGPGSGLVVAFSLISAALAAVILYLLYRPDSNAYYEAMSDIRR
ncbi:MAG TPA: hypothetical protein VHI11_14635 [Jiangellaceae bacterium]|jgi:hypothetical protein|nr:hypothetical protein [Jiangellaceae bacterium]